MTNEEIIKTVDSELSFAGMDGEQMERLKQLERRRITSQTVVEEQEYLFRLYGTPCFPRGELVGLQGKMKSGKTFLCSILIALCMQRSVLGMERIRERGIRVLWIDTEQSRQSTQKILRNRIRRMIGAEYFPDELVDVFNLRASSWAERLPLVEAAVRTLKPELVIFDGIRDCVNDINDYEMANDVVTRLTQLASGHQLEDGEPETTAQWPACCIVCVLHENKSVEDHSLRGALGTELGHKCWESFLCSKDLGSLVFSVEQTVTREYDIREKLLFTVDNQGLPQLRDLNAMMGTKEAEPVFVNANGTYNYEVILRSILGCNSMRSGALERRVRELLSIGHEKACNIVYRGVSEGLIVREQRSAREVYYTMADCYRDRQQDLFLSEK